ncbi:hypothetical protein LXA43DRAFT_1002141 [Ganoderma leucocontextum]|nr:hypothetical protein LXA43DRAFT_1002141 [Ganoderma leucocontextum]
MEVFPMAADVNFDAVPPAVEQGLREGRVTDFKDWKRIDAEEVWRGEAADGELGRGAGVPIWRGSGREVRTRGRRA